MHGVFGTEVDGAHPAHALGTIVPIRALDNDALRLNVELGEFLLLRMSLRAIVVVAGVDSYLHLRVQAGIDVRGGIDAVDGKEMVVMMEGGNDVAARV